MDGQLTVELADLRGWARQVGRAADGCGYLADYVRSFAPDGDFGPILALIRSDYERLVARVDEVLAVDAARLAETQAALQHAATRYAHTDARVAQDFGVGVAIVDDGRVDPRFGDTGPTTPEPPVCGGEVLSMISLTWGFSQANDLLVSIGGPDLRRELTDLVAGDIGKALTQASVWESSAQALAAIRGNLAHGSEVVGRSWAGEAASSSRALTDGLVAELGSQSDTLALVAEHLRDAVAQAVDVAQLVADAIQLVISTFVAGWTLPSIPIFGQLQLADKLKDALRLVWEARKVLAVFWSFLVCIKDAFSMAVDGFGAAALPPAPVLPARLA
jgi:uncharacterized protein YukE